VVRAPSFDHAAGDPVVDGVTLSGSHRIVFVEGNYLYLPDQPWAPLHGLFHERWFVATDPATSSARIVERHMAVWGSTREEATHRAAANDGPNAELVWATRDRAAPHVWMPVLHDADFVRGVNDKQRQQQAGKHTHAGGR
jgi:pantothenate kinase